MAGPGPINGHGPRRGAPPRAVIGVLADEETRMLLVDAATNRGIAHAFELGDIDTALAGLHPDETADCVIVDLETTPDAVDDVAVLATNLPSYAELILLGSFAQHQVSELVQAGARLCLPKPLSEAAIARILGAAPAPQRLTPQRPVAPPPVETAPQWSPDPGPPPAEPHPVQYEARRPPPAPEPPLELPPEPPPPQPHAYQPLPAAVEPPPPPPPPPLDLQRIAREISRQPPPEPPRAEPPRQPIPHSPPQADPPPPAPEMRRIAPETAREPPPRFAEAPPSYAAPTQPRPAPAQGRVISILGCRGGVGATSIAVGLAWLLAEDMERNTALVDLDPYFGSAALALNLEPGDALLQALERPSRIDAVFLDRAMRKSGQNLFVLASEQSFDRQAKLDSAAPALLVRNLIARHERVVVDLPRHDLEALTRVLALSDETILVSDLSLAGARDTMRLMALARAANIYSRLRIVGGGGRDTGKSPILSPSEFRRAVGAPIDITIGHDAETASDAARSGRPIPKVFPRSAASKALRNLVQSLESSEQREPKRRLLFWKR